MSRVARLGVVAMLLVLAWMVTAAPANAVLGISDCAEPPAPAAPTSGASGFFTSPPDTPPSGPSWVNGAPAYEHYGTAGLRFHTYDLGCVPGPSDFGAGASTTVANWVLEAVAFGVAATGAILDAAYEPTYLSVFDPLLADATAALRTAIFDYWVPLSLAVLGLGITLAARRGEWSRTFAAVGWGLLVLLIAAAVFNYPVQAGSAADETASDVLTAVNDGINGTTSTSGVDASMGTLTNAVMWEEWKMGTFGTAEVPDDIAQGIFTNQALTWAEYETAAQDPAAAEQMFEDKAEGWEAAAERLKDTDPGMYAHLTGQNGQTRVAAAFISVVALVCTAPFLIASGLLMIGAYLIVRLAVVFFPVIATFGVLYSARGAVKGVGVVVGAAVGNSILFGVGAAVTLFDSRLLLAGALPTWLGLLLMLVHNVVMWVALKPFRTLTRMVSPNRVFSDAAGALGSTVGSVRDTTTSVVKAAAASYLGNSAALRSMVDADESEEPRAETKTTRPPAPDLAPTPTEPGPPTPGELPAAEDRAPLPPSTPPPPPAELPPGTGATVDPEPEPRATPLPPPGDAPFVPADEEPPTPETRLPAVLEPSIDPETGDEVYPLFTPDDDNAVT